MVYINQELSFLLKDKQEKKRVVTKRGNHQTSGEPAANQQYFRERPANHQLPLRTISPLISQQIFCLDVTTPV